MRSRIPSLRVLALLLLLGPIFALTACVHADHHGRRAKGPPPHAAAHGYRHKLDHHGGVQIAFDSGIGVYVVSGRTDVYFWDDQFYRWHNGAWQISAHLDRGWISIGRAKLPGHLAKKGKGRGHARKHKAKHGR